ncbi:MULTISPECIES: hypothetical protein [unclassified Rathayibacter]|nr:MULTISPECIES: hypothetical protein [unclassified Rathayibacter]
MLIDATRRERDLTSARSSATQTRAGVLVGAAGLVGTASTLSTDLMWIPLLGFGVAVALGIWALVPDKGHAVPTQNYLDNATSYTPVDLLETILRKEIEANEASAKVVSERSWLTIVGFIVLVLAFGIAILFNINDALTEPSPLKVMIVEE